jgi:hypothetical protein
MTEFQMILLRYRPVLSGLYKKLYIRSEDREKLEKVAGNAADPLHGLWDAGCLRQ